MSEDESQERKTVPRTGPSPTLLQVQSVIDKAIETNATKQLFVRAKGSKSSGYEPLECLFRIVLYNGWLTSIPQGYQVIDDESFNSYKSEFTYLDVYKALRSNAKDSVPNIDGSAREGNTIHLFQVKNYMEHNYHSHLLAKAYDLNEITTIIEERMMNEHEKFKYVIHLVIEDCGLVEMEKKIEQIEAHKADIHPFMLYLDVRLITTSELLEMYKKNKVLPLQFKEPVVATREESGCFSCFSCFRGCTDVKYVEEI